MENHDRSLRDLQRIAQQVYGKYDLNASIVWFVEEIGELVAAIRKRKDRDFVKEELGDVFAWVLCLSNILEQDLDGAVIESIDKEVRRQYKVHGRLKYADASFRWDPRGADADASRDALAR